jgi:hypothetical protein
MEFVGILLICLHAVFHVPGTMVIIAIKLEAKCRFCMVVMFLILFSFSLKGVNYPNKSWRFLFKCITTQNSLILPLFASNGSSVTTVSQVCVATLLAGN